MVISVVSISTDAISGCAGDCMTCHPTLENSPEHQSLKTCKNCHNDSKPKLKISSMNDGCGDRCFMCHNQWPKDGAHASLDNCLECHEK